MEAEFIALSETVKEIIWLSKSLKACKNLKLNLPLPKIFTDSQSAIHFSNNLNENQRTKHIDVRFNFVKSLLSQGEFNLFHVSGKTNVADILTKPLEYCKFNSYCKDLFFQRL